MSYESPSETKTQHSKPNPNVPGPRSYQDSPKVNVPEQQSLKSYDTPSLITYNYILFGTVIDEHQAHDVANFLDKETPHLDIKNVGEFILRIFERAQLVNTHDPFAKDAAQEKVDSAIGEYISLITIGRNEFDQEIYDKVPDEIFIKLTIPKLIAEAVGKAKNKKYLDESLVLTQRIFFTGIVKERRE